MNCNRYISILTVALLLLATGCKDRSPVSVESESNNNVDFSTYASVGNSLTAGFQSGALYEAAQEYSFPNLLARQFHVIDSFEQPLIEDPGIGNRIELQDDLTTVTVSSEQGTPINGDLDRPFNNLGIPGSILADFTGQDLPGAPYSARRSENPFFDVVLRDLGNTQAEQLGSLEPTFVTFWQGNNDVLGYVTSGGHTAYTPPANFTALYQASAGQIAATGADAVLYNIPNVTAIPYVFLVNQTLLSDGTITVNQQGHFALVTQQGNVPLWVQTTDPNNPGAVQDTVQMEAPDPGAGQPGSFFLLPARSELSQLFSEGIGLSPGNPIPSMLVLDEGETLQALTLVGAYNVAIQAAAAANNFPIVDVNTLFDQIIADGSITRNGLTLRPVPGELFSFDGVHPGNRGHAILANETIEVINNNYGTNVQTIDISTIPQGIPVASGY